LTEFLRGPFLFGVPNRDFLICWSKNNDTAFQDRMGDQIAQDYDERSYPLSRFVFEVSGSGEILQLKTGTPDERPALARNN